MTAKIAGRASLPDGIRVALFPGTDPSASAEQIADEVRRAVNKVVDGDFDMIPSDPDA